ncbi:MAG: hypothetical protein IPH93_03150 [Saprospiraceae bacterium]|nr:hypothetical protein [Saprospiraceae bacterium]
MVHGQSKINEEAKVAKFYTDVLFKNELIKYLEQIADIDIKLLFKSELLSSTFVLLGRNINR